VVVPVCGEENGSVSSINKTVELFSGIRSPTVKHSFHRESFTNAALFRKGSPAFIAHSPEPRHVTGESSLSSF
jgi:hypothetical protein